MNITDATPGKLTLYYRFIALWVICEAFAGGVMHGLKIPFTGMLVSSLAVFCIILISRFIDSPGAILKATIIVAVFKLMLSPHSPPTAYLAVFFQGITGQFLLSGKSNFTLRYMLFGLVALVESGIQRLLVLVILYGNKFWDAVDAYLQKLFDTAPNKYSLWLAGIYILIHAIAGLLVGYYSARIVKFSKEALPEYMIHIGSEKVIPRSGKRKKIKSVFIITWLALIIMLIHSLFYPDDSIVARQYVLLIILRAAIIILTWYLFIIPILMILIKTALKKQKLKYQGHVLAVEQLLPSTLNLFKQSWIRSNGLKGSRLSNFFRLITMNIVHQDSTGTKKN